uniref:THAP-type domain-containing protein n=1 Tax=Neolamprologus brichardi TaxID=32507 RepID=A0A3Q4HKB2_NEOBR
MVRTCCVIGCNVSSRDRQRNKSESGLSFHSFPTWKQHEGVHVADVTKRRRLAWKAAVRRPDMKFSSISKHLLVCSRHFQSGKPAYVMDETNPDWVPTQHMGHSEILTSNSDRHRRRTQREQQRAPVGGKDHHHHPHPQLAAANVENLDLTVRHTEATRQTKDCVCCEQSRAEVNRLLEENRKLQSQLKKTELNEHFLKDDTEKVRYYTGLPCFAILLAVFDNVKAFLPASKKLSHFQMLLLTLMRLRLDLPVQHLCDLFNVSHKALSSVFTDTIDVLYARLGALVHWPERHCLQATMPPQFIETFGKRVAVIVDCFEIRTERPSNLKAHAQTYSRYKGLGGGSASDRHITEKCGILQRLLPGDVVLADRGFDIRDPVGMMCAEVKIPAYTKGFCQLDARDIEDTRAIAHLRIHVERVIGTLRNKFKMLHTTMPIRLRLPCEGEDVTLLDKIVKVCCVLVNMCPSVVVKPGTTETCSC